MNKKLKQMSLAAPVALALGSGFAAASFAADAQPGILSGVVTSSKGPEAGVWVIAETRDLPTRFIKIVVTDDQGRYLLPELPPGVNYDVWVRGYGLVDSAKVKSQPGNRKLDLKAVVAPNETEAAQYYPANYWLSMMPLPGKSEFPGTGPEGNGLPPTVKSQQEWASRLKSGCLLCHQQGGTATRIMKYSTPQAWHERLTLARPEGDQTVGNHGAGIAQSMLNNMTMLGSRGLKVFADWTHQVGEGKLPAEKPSRPKGVERNVVVTVWDFAFGRALHDQISTDRRNPTVNAGGPIYALAPTTGNLELLDPVTHKPSEIALPPLPGKAQMNVYPHNPMLDGKGRVWMTDWGQYTLPKSQMTTPAARADFCGNPSNKFAKYYPMPGSTSDKRILMFDPTNEGVASIPSCFGVHHLGFAANKEDTLYFSGDTNVVGWMDTKVYDETRDVSKAMGWCPMVLDTSNGASPANGPAIETDQAKWNQPARAQPVRPGEEGGGGGALNELDPAKDTRISGFLYGMDVNLKDGSVWFGKTSPFPMGIVRFERGANPPETCKTEFYEPPQKADGNYEAFLSRSVSVDLNGVAWVAFNSGKMASFDRRKCKVTRGPTATGQHCPEGWTFYDIPGPKFVGTDISADWHYTNWVDVYNTFGLGQNIPITPGTNSDSIFAIMPGTTEVHQFRVPYPRGFFGRGMDGRVDDPKAGWKGKGLWSIYAMTANWHQEGGLDAEGPQMVKFQLRSNPLEQ